MTNQSKPNDAYFDRNQAVLAFAALAIDNGFVVGVAVDPLEPDWPVLIIDLPSGQVSWHIPRAEWIGSWPDYPGKWDGHTVEEKRDRLGRWLESMVQGFRLPRFSGG